MYCVTINSFSYQNNVINKIYFECLIKKTHTQQHFFKRQLGCILDNAIFARFVEVLFNGCWERKEKKSENTRLLNVLVIT